MGVTDYCVETSTCSVLLETGLYNGFHGHGVNLQRVELIDREAFARLLDVPEMTARAPVSAGAQAARQPLIGQWSRASDWSRGVVPGLAPLHRPVDRHGSAGEVLQLLDARLSPEVGGRGEGRGEAGGGLGDPGVCQQLLCSQPPGAVLGQQLEDEEIIITIITIISIIIAISIIIIIIIIIITISIIIIIISIISIINIVVIIIVIVIIIIIIITYLYPPPSLSPPVS